jgi:hypothetical protein
MLVIIFSIILIGNIYCIFNYRSKYFSEVEKNKKLYKVIVQTNNTNYNLQEENLEYRIHIGKLEQIINVIQKHWYSELISVIDTLPKKYVNKFDSICQEFETIL